MTAVFNQLRILLAPGDKARLIGIAVLMSVGAVLEIAGIGLVLPVVAVLVKPELLEQNIYLSRFYQSFGFAEHRTFMVFCCILLGSIYAVKNIFSLWIVQVQSAFVFRKHWEWCDRLYHIYLRAPYAYHLEHAAAELNNNIIRVSQVCAGVLLPAMLLLTDLMVVLALGLLLLFFMPAVTLGCLGFMIIAGWLIYWPLRALNFRWGKSAMDADMAAARNCLNGLLGIKAVKAAGAENFFLRRYREAQQSYCLFSRKLYVLGQIPRLGLETAAIFGSLGLLVILVWLGRAPGTILLTFSLLIAAMSRMLPSFSRMHYNLARIRQLLYAFDNLFRDLTAVAPENLGSEQPEHLTLREMLEIRDLTFGYGPELLFERFSLRIPARSSVALVGTTGCGKTTLADLLQGFLVPQQGEILADGCNVLTHLRSWRRTVGYVPQFIYLLDDSVRANVALGEDPANIDEARMREALQLAQAEEFVRALPDGLDTVIGDNGVKLSGGQRQRLGIARALYRQPELLILDEATSALDHETEAAFVAALESLHGRMTLLVIAHRLSTVEKCDQVVRLERG